MFLMFQTKYGIAQITFYKRKKNIICVAKSSIKHDEVGSDTS